MRPYIKGESSYNVVARAIPDFAEAEYPLFVEFITTFLRFMEQERVLVPKTIYPEYGTVANSTMLITQSLGGPFYEARKLLDYRDIDSSLDEFKTHFLTMFGKNFPTHQYIPTDLFVKSLRQFYQSKGTVESVQWLFRTLFNEHAEVYFPRVDVLRASDGTWIAPITLKVSAPIAGSGNSLDINTFYIGQRVQTTTGSAQVESIVTNVVGQAYNQNIVVYELRLRSDSILGVFLPGQDLSNIDSPTLGTVHTTILPVISDVIVNAGGSNYAIGDVVTFSEGPAGGYGFGAFGLVSLVSNTAISGVTVIDGGNGFLVGQPVTFISTLGHGAAGVVSEISDGQNMLALELVLDPFANASVGMVIDSADYGSDSGVVQLNGVGIDSQINLATSAVDEKPFMHPWVFTDANETIAELANAACDFTATSNAYFANGSTVFSLTSLQDIASNVSSAQTSATIIVAKTDDGGLSGTLYLKEFTGLDRLAPGMIFKGAPLGVPEDGTVSSNGSANVVGAGTTFTTVCQPNTHLRFQNGVDAVVRAVVNDTFLTTFAAVGSAVTANTYQVVPVISATTITPQAQRYYGKIKSVVLQSAGVHYDIPPTVVADSVSARAQELFHLNPDPVSPVDTTSNTNAIDVSSGIHVFDVPTLAAQQSAGQVQKVKIVESGVNYQDANTVVITAVHTPPRTGDAAHFTPVIGARTQYPGQFTTSRGFLSADKFLQDIEFYNEYTYVIRVGESFDRYKNLLTELVHPAGFQVLGRFVDVLDAPFVVPNGTTEETFA